MSPVSAWMRALPGVARSPFARNAVALYGVNFTAYLFPLVTAPYLARVLHPEGWGRVALAQSLGQSLTVVVEYGFALSATREVSRATVTERAELLGAVVGAKLVLAVVAAVAAIALVAVLPTLRADPLLAAAAVFWAVAQGLHPLWYYQGREQVRPLLMMDLGSGLLAIAGVLWWCREPSDAWKVLALQGGAAAAVVLGGYARAAREVAPHVPSWSAVRARLTNGVRLFGYRAAVTLYTVANPLLLGLLAPTAVVGYFAGADKIVRAIFLAGIHPLNQALYPRASRLAHASGSERATGRGIALLAVLGGVAGAVVAVAAPLLVRVLLGPDYVPAVGALRVLALLLPILALSTAVTMQRLLPAARDGALMAITIAAGTLNVALATFLAPRYGQVGMAASVVITEAVVLLGVWRVARTASR